MTNPCSLIWVDLETTGLDPKRDLVLEVAVAVAPFSDPFAPRVRRSWVLPVRLEPPTFSRLHPIVQEMHSKNGLFKECEEAERSGANSLNIWQEVLKLIPMVEDRDEKPVLAGSTVHFDRRFLAGESISVELERRLSHRLFDVSAVKLFCQSLGMEKLPKAEAHRAAADIEESITHARKCRNWLAYWSPGLSPHEHLSCR